MPARKTIALIIFLFCTIPWIEVLAADDAQGNQKISSSQSAPETLSFKNIYDLTWGDNQFVAVGYNGLVLTSPDGAIWKVQRINRSRREYLRGVAWGNGLYVAVGSWGIILTSSDAITWAVHQPPSKAGTKLIQVDWVNNQFVAVGENGLILTSSDGADWTRQDSGTAEELLGVAGGNGLFVAVSKQGTILTSPNGTDWTSNSLEGAKFLNSVAWSGQEFVAVGSLGYGSVIARSLDGQEWEVKEFGGYRRLLFDVTWSGTHFVAVGADILISPDGKEWTFLNAGAPDTGYWLDFRRVSGTNDSYVAIGPGGEVFTSHDGMTWRGGENVLINLSSGQTRIPDTTAQTSPVDEATEVKYERLWDTISGGLIGFAMSGGSLLLYVVLQVWSIKRMRGGWRVFAILPLVPVAGILIASIIGLNQGANLWPIGIILLLPLALGYLVLLLVLHALFKRLSNKSTPAL